MPLYKYKREDGTTFEIKQSINDDRLEECPETGQPCKRIISGGITTLFKGSNWNDKEVRKQNAAEKKETTLPKYKKRIDEQTKKAEEMEEKAKQGEKIEGKIL